MKEVYLGQISLNPIFQYRNTMIWWNEEKGYFQK